MSLFSSIGSVFTKVAKGIGFNRATAAGIAGIALPGIGGIVASAGLAKMGSSPARISSTAPSSTTTENIPIPGQGLERLLPGGKTGYASRSKFKPGRLSGNPIPHGYHEKMSPAGMIYLVKSRRRRGITARDLQTYRRVHRTLKTYSKKYK